MPFFKPDFFCQAFFLLKYSKCLIFIKVHTSITNIMAKEQKYGIKFPINVSSDDKTLFDLDNNRVEMIKSEIMHLIFTPVGQRLRKPTFGTRLIQFIFNPDDASTFGDVVSEIKERVKTNIPSCNIQDIEVVEAENGLQMFVKIKYTLSELDGSTGNYEIIAKL